MFFQILYFMCVLVGPVLSFATLALLLAKGWSLPHLRSILYWSKIAFYWSAIEVLVVGLVVTIIEIGPVTAYIVDFITADVCGYVKPAIELAVEDGVTDGFCLDVVGSFEPFAFATFLTAVFHVGLFYIITLMARVVIDDRYYNSYKELRRDVKPKKLTGLARKVIRFMTMRDTPNERDKMYDIEEDYIQRGAIVEKNFCARLGEMCCSTQRGEELADARIAAWQDKFGSSTPSPASHDPGMQAQNPVYSDVNLGQNEARVRPASQASVDV
jgi:hypothetical protein